MHSGTPYQVLLVDDEPQVLRMLEDIFSDEFQTISAASGPESVALVQENPGIAAVLMDIKMAGMDGITAAREIRTLAPDTPIIFHTGYPGDYNEDEIDEAEKPFEYVKKGEALSRVMRAVRNAVNAYQARQDSRWLTTYAETAFGMIGQSVAMQKVFRLIRKIGPSETKVMITGETGTGKELVARAIHASSRRNQHKMAILNCNHKAPDLVESELFGHIKGAFTGAIADRIGLFEYADGGTVFLDEIGDLDITTQAKLLRVLETGEYLKIGSEGVRKTNVRILCATHKNLEAMVKEKQFREDLYYRLRGVTIVLPPLRDRREDIPLLVERFKDRVTIGEGTSPKIFDDRAVGNLVDFEWPGNVRQLKDTVESLIALAESDVIFAEDVADYMGIEKTGDDSQDESLSEQLREVERTLILKALHRTQYNVNAAARLLQIDPANLRKKIHLHHIDLSTLRETL